MSFQGLIQHGLRTCENVFGGAAGAPTFDWRGQTYPCIVSGLRRGTAIAVGGFEVMIVATLIVRKDVLPERLTVDSDEVTVDSSLITTDQDFPPSAGKIVTHKNRRYRVGAVTEPVGNAHWQIDLIDPEH